MTESQPDDLAYSRARERVKSIQAFYYSLVVYVVVNIGLFLVNLVTRGDDGGWWFFWVTIFWGIGMVFWGVSIFAGSSRRGRDWEERKIQEYMDQERGAGGSSDASAPENPISD